jgi:hypothetical protein
MKRKILSLILAFAITAVPIVGVGQIQVLKINDLKGSTGRQTSPDLYIKDTPLDVGNEPNGDPGPMWVTEDIWVRNQPDPGYQPFPFP